jgi:hypothetical protein
VTIINCPKDNSPEEFDEIDAKNLVLKLISLTNAADRRSGDRMRLPLNLRTRYQIRAILPQSPKLLNFRSKQKQYDMQVHLNKCH